MNPSATDDEPGRKRGIFLVVALAIVVGFGFFMAGFWAPAPGRPGIDENAYLLSGRNIVERHSLGWKPGNDYQFAGHMWFRTEDKVHAAPGWLPGFLRKWSSVHTEAGWYYPKYPAGLPMLNAMVIKIGGVVRGKQWAFAVSPACMCLALAGMFFLARCLVGSFYGVLAMIVLATGPTSLLLAELPNSHAPDLCFVVWGMFFLVRFVQTGAWWRGGLAGLLLGYAVTIRYSEALLLFPFYSIEQIFSDVMPGLSHPVQWMIKGVRFLPVGPVGLAAMMGVRWKNWRTYWRGVLMLAAWAVPVGLLVAYNWFSTGQMTGYDSTNESSGFSVATILHKWDYTIYQLYLFGVFLFLPLGVAGLVMMFRERWKMSLLLVMWFVPGTLLYMAYYWGEEVPGTGFLRFFLTLFPPVIIGGMWVLRAAGLGSTQTEIRWRGSVFAPLAAGILTAAAAAIGLSNSLGDMQRQYRGNLNLHYSESRLRAHVPANAKRPVIFADNGLFPMFLQYGQFMIDADWYATDIFEPKVGGGFGILGMFQQDQTDKNAAVLLQQDRIDYIDRVRQGKSDEDFIRDEHGVMDAALRGGRKIFLLTTPDDADYFRRRFISGKYQMKEIDHWREPCAIIFPPEREQNRLGFPAWSGEPFIHWQPQRLNLYEIEWKISTGIFKKR